MSDSKTLERVASNGKAVNYEAVIPNVLKAMAMVNEAMAASGFDRTIHHLVQLRASQINGCAYCVKMHTREARDDGETSERLDRLIVWEHVGDFTARERAALAWTEALTVLDPKTNLEALRTELREQFSEAEIGILTGTIAQINLWNRIAVSRH